MVELTAVILIRLLVALPILTSLRLYRTVISSSEIALFKIVLSGLN